MSIDFENDVFPLYATNVVVDPEYADIPAERRDADIEQKILTAVEVVRSLMEEFRSDEEARVFHYAMSRILAGVAYTNVYDDVTVRVVGNDSNIAGNAANGDTIDVTDAAGTDNVVLAAAPYTSMAGFLADINGQISTANVEAYSDAGRLAFRNAAGNEGDAITIEAGAGPSLMDKAGFTAGETLNPVARVANAARDDALAHFARNGNPVTL